MKNLIITTKSGRHRKEHSFEISDEVAADPIKRAQTISVKVAGLNDRMVNWTIRDVEA